MFSKNTYKIHIKYIRNTYKIHTKYMGILLDSAIAVDQCASTERDRTRATRAVAAAAGVVAAAAAAMAAAELGNLTTMRILIN